MARYIDADELINKINAYVINSQDVMYIRELIKETPTADVVEVVRCENCKHYYWDDETGHYCNVRLVETYNSDFCSDGVRKADTNKGTR